MRGTIRVAFLIACLVAVGGGFYSVSADRFSSTNYVIDASVMNTAGGSSSSTSYKLVGSTGETVIGNGASGSYKMGAGFVSQLENSLQLAVQPSGLVAFYPLDEAAGGAIYDSSSNGNNGTVGGSSSWQTGKLSGGITVDPTATASVKVPDNANLPTGTAMTVEIWAKPNVFTTNRALISQWDYTGALPVSGGWALQTSNTDGSRLRFYVADSSGDVGVNYVDTPVSSWAGTTWKHVVVTYDGSLSASSRAKIYIDGVQQTTAMGGTIPSTLINAAAPLVIGDFMGLDRQFNGVLDHAKIYNRALSADEVKAEYTGQNAGTSSGVFAGTVIPGVSSTATYDAVVRTDTANYSLAINQNQNLTNGGDSIPAISGSIASPASWVEGTTKGLGFTLFGTNATAIDGKWSSGAAYAAFPGSATTIYNRTGLGGSTPDILNMRLRLDTATTQAALDYTNVITVTGTITP